MFIMDTSNNEYFIMHFTKSALQEVIQNLKIILENKQMIMDTEFQKRRIEFQDGYAADFVDSQFFRLDAGLCDNANLWLLFEDSYNDGLNSIPIYTLDKKFCSCSFMTYLGNKFSFTTRNKKNSFMPVRSTVNDIHYVQDALWKNPERWEYVEFCLVELEHLLNTSTIKG